MRCAVLDNLGTAMVRASISRWRSTRGRCFEASVEVWSACWARAHQVVDVELGGPCLHHLGGAEVRISNLETLPRQCPDADERPRMRPVGACAGCVRPLVHGFGCSGRERVASHVFVLGCGKARVLACRLTGPTDRTGRPTGTVRVPVMYILTYLHRPCSWGGYTVSTRCNGCNRYVGV